TPNAITNLVVSPFPSPRYEFAHRLYLAIGPTGVGYVPPTLPAGSGEAGLVQCLSNSALVGAAMTNPRVVPVPRRLLTPPGPRPPHLPSRPRPMHRLHPDQADGTALGQHAGRRQRRDARLRGGRQRERLSPVARGQAQRSLSSMAMSGAA